MPIPEKTKKPKKLDKGKKGELPKKAKKGSGNLLIILSVVGVVVLLAVGITIFMLVGGNKDTAANSGTNPNRAVQQPENPADGAGTGAATPDLGELTAKLSDLVDKLGDASKSEESGKLLRELLESDQINKTPGGRTLALTVIMTKAKAGNDGAKQFLQKLSKDSSNASLALDAKKLYDEHLKQAGESTAMDTDVGEEPTNYLPNKVDVIFSMRMSKFIDSEYHKGIFTTGAFRQEDIDKSLGMPANTIDQLVMGGMKDFNQVVGIVRTTKPYNWDDVKKTMQLEDSGNTIKGKTYYLGKIDFLTDLLGQRMPGIDALRNKAAIWRVDARTLVYADETTMKDLLENPPEKDKALTPPETVAQPGGNPPAGNTPPAGGSGLSITGLGSGGAAGAGDTAGADVGLGVAEAKRGGADTAKKTSEPAKPERFLTIDIKIRRLIRLTEDHKLDSLLLFCDKTTSKVPVLMNYVTYLDRLPSVRMNEIDTLVMALPSVTGSPSLRLGVACKSRSTVREVSSEIEKLLVKIGKEDLHELFGFDFQLTQIASAQDNQSGGATAGGGGGPAGAAGLMGGKVGRIGSGGALGGMGADLGVPSAPGGALSAGSSGGPPTAGGTQPVQGDSGTDNSGGHFTLERSDEYVIITATVKSSLSEFISKHMISWMQQLRGSQEMNSGKFRFGDLAASLDFYKADLTRNNRPIAFPQGAFPRTFDAERGPRPYPARERISFFRELLPYLGDDRYFGMERMIDPEKSWRDPHNLTYARIVVPHFLNPAAGTGSTYVKVRGVDHPVAVTHFVGMAGVGPDSAYLPKSDPRAGIFGYDRQSSPDDVKDGLSNTIYMIEADKALLGPWLQGGGATVRGTSVEGNDVGRRGGFSSPNYSGKPGVWVMMADGSARFLTKDVSPEVFKALCTMAGSDSAGAIDLIAGKVNLEVTPRTENTSATPAVKKKRIVEEEEVPVKK